MVVLTVVVDISLVEVVEVIVVVVVDAVNVVNNPPIVVVVATVVVVEEVVVTPGQFIPKHVPWKQLSHEQTVLQPDEPIDGFSHHLHL